LTPGNRGVQRVDTHQVEGWGSTPGRTSARNGLSLALAIGAHVLLLGALAVSMSFHFIEPVERISEPKIVALAPRVLPPPPDVEKFGPTDIVTTVPRFRPRVPAVVRQRRPGDPALAIWKYLCNRDQALSEATQRNCPAFDLGNVGLGWNDPLNRTGDVGALFGADTTTMSLDEVARKKGWAKPKTPWPADGARAKGDDIALPGHDPFASLPKEKSRIWGGP
jgi:hypothetical protein